jgi:hypothetical protein
MIKKLKIIICFAAALIIGVQALSAQESSQKKATAGRFSTDVDKFFSVNDWADLGISKWFSYLQLADVKANDWQTGLGIKLDKVYLSVFYNGQFNFGTTSEGTWGDGEEPDLTISQPGGVGTITVAGLTDNAGNDLLENQELNPANPPKYSNAITHKNKVGLLVGLGAHGFKLTLDDQTQTINIPKIQVTADQDIYDAQGNVTKTIKAGSTGSYQKRYGKITPNLAWGAAQEMTFGKFASKPSAQLYMTIYYDDEVVRINDEDIVDHRDNYLIPGLIVDTGGVTIWQGDWGKLQFGLTEELAIKVLSDGNNGSVAWEDRLEPNSSFSIDLSKNLGLKSKVAVPLWFGYDNGGNGFFGVGAKGDGASGVSPTKKYLPTFSTGFKYTFTSDGLAGELVEKLKMDNVMSVNFGITANLPGYLFDSGFNKTQNGGQGPNGTEARSYTWTSGYSTDRVIQSVSAGLTFNILKNFAIDMGYSWEGENTWTVLVSAKY